MIYMTSDMKKIQLSLEDELHRILKSSAALKGKTLHDYIVEILAESAKK